MPKISETYQRAYKLALEQFRARWDEFPWNGQVVGEVTEQVAKALGVDENDREKWNKVKRGVVRAFREARVEWINLNWKGKPEV